MAECFDRQCAYCGNPLTDRWHADHLVSVDSGGFNHISNRVPACPRCNEHEKRDEQWLRFLESKCGGDTALLKARRMRIEAWMRRHSPKTPPVTDAQRSAWRQEVDALATAIDTAWKRLKELGAG